MTDVTQDVVRVNSYEEIGKGLEMAARFVEKRRDDYVRDHGSYDPDTGMTEFPGTGEEYVGELEEIIEGIRSLLPPVPVNSYEEMWAALETEPLSEADAKDARIVSEWVKASRLHAGQSRLGKLIAARIADDLEADGVTEADIDRLFPRAAYNGHINAHQD